jgi:hypothetical protein
MAVEGIPVYITSGDRKVLGGSAYPVYIKGGVSGLWVQITGDTMQGNLNGGGYEFSNYGENTTTASSSSGAITLSALSGFTTVTLTENIASLSFIWPANADYATFQVDFVQDGAGGWTIDFGGLYGSSSSAPTISLAIGATSSVIFSTFDGGATVRVDGVGVDYGVIP